MQETFACMHHEVVLHTFLTYTVMCICMHAYMNEHGVQRVIVMHGIGWKRVKL